MASPKENNPIRAKEIEHYIDRFLSTTCDASRRRILEYLILSSQDAPDSNPAERSVGEIAAHLGLALSTTSEHLKELLQVHLLATRKEGKKTYYRLRNKELVLAFRDLVDALDGHYRKNTHPLPDLQEE